MNDEYGKVVDLQKSQWNSKDRLSFTITDLYKIEYR
nr:hypothetical protein [Leptospira noguchii]